MFGCGKSEGRCGNRSRGVGKCGGRCEKVRWGVREGEGRLGDIGVGKCVRVWRKMCGEVWGCEKVCWGVGGGEGRGVGV